MNLSVDSIYLGLHINRLFFKLVRMIIFSGKQCASLVIKLTEEQIKKKKKNTVIRIGIVLEKNIEKEQGLQ